MDQEEVSLFDEPGEKPATQATSAAPRPDNIIPEKFRGKSLEDVISSYVNLEKELGNKGNEIGELRKLTDQILLTQASQQKAQHPVEREDINEDVGFDDFIDDPASAIERVLKTNPRIRRLEENLEKNDTEMSRKALLSRHSDADDVVASPEFQRWVQEAPTRLRILQEAHVNRDVAAASDLLDMYKTTRKAATATAIDERDAIAKDTFRKASVETGGAPASSKKVYRRAELIQLKIRDPNRYDAMSSEIRAAYAEGRVK